jgi:hypothetical protein
MSAEYGGTRSATSDAVSKGTNPVFDTVPTVNNNHGSAAHAGFNGEVLEKHNLKLDTIPISATDHQSACSDIDTLMGFAAVEENCEDCKEPEHWCWNKEYSVFTGKVTSSRQTKRRRVGDNV